MLALTTELYKPTTSKTRVESRGSLNNLYECYFYNFNTFTTKSNTHELLCNSLFMANWARESLHIPEMKKKQSMKGLQLKSTGADYMFYTDI